MAIDRADLAARVAEEGRVVRVVLADVSGSSPREAGAAMIVGARRVTGTIGGGALEHAAIAAARGLDQARVESHALGPDLGQCCGGRVTLVFEPFDAAAVAGIGPAHHLRPVLRDAGPQPRGMARQATRTGPVPVTYRQGWLLEPVDPMPRLALWIWGAGHVGRALVGCLSPVPGVRITWADTDAARFPDTLPASVTTLPAADLPRLAGYAPPETRHVVATYSHDFDLRICDALLRERVDRIGLIGSATKWARFRKRLREMGHLDAQIARIDCPIGDPGLGKHPQEIAVGVAAGILRDMARQDAPRDKIT